MPLIKPRTRGKQFVRLITRLDRENNETLYAHFISESAEYLLNQPVESLLAKDKEFIAWRAEHPTRMCHSRCVSARRRTRRCRLLVHGRRPSRTPPHPVLSPGRRTKGKARDSSATSSPFNGWSPLVAQR